MAQKRLYKVNEDTATFLLLLTYLVIDFLVNLSASADVLAQAKVEIDLSTIPTGKNVRMIRFVLLFPDPATVRSLLNGEASQSSSAIVLKTKSSQHKIQTGTSYEIHNQMKIERKSQNG